jgi:adenylyltransferase/sulfurtransferase
MDDERLLRYSRQILLPEIGIEGQERLAAASALVIGLGGLGSPVAMYLAAAGIGRLELVDDDRVDLSNLQRQILHGNDAVGEAKTTSAQRTLARLNPDTRIDLRRERLEPAALAEAGGRADVVLDCSDNFATRFAINAACRDRGRALVSGAAIRWEGQVSVFAGRAGAPCYRCLYDTEGREDESCSNNGVVAPVVGIIGSVQALEAVKLLCGVGESLDGRLLLLDGLRMRWRELRLKPDPACPVCGP